jgi:hypothetical protein
VSTQAKWPFLNVGHEPFGRAPSLSGSMIVACVEDPAVIDAIRTHLASE